MTGGDIILAAGLLLAGSEWGYSPGEEAPSARHEIFVQFSGDGRVSGSGGCNRFTGSYEQDGVALKFGPLAATRMACADDGVMRREQEFLDMLEAVRAAKATHMTLVLEDGEGKELAVLVRRDWD